MSGINYHNLAARPYYLPSIKCIFISHQKQDSSAAKMIADYLIAAGVNVYFDEYDNTLDLTNPASVVAGIKDGLNHSTHLLVLLSQNALQSMWIPWEVGYAYDSKTIISLTLKEISSYELPEYLQITRIIRGTNSLNELISEILNNSQFTLTYETKVFDASRPNHPLDSILTWNK